MEENKFKEGVLSERLRVIEILAESLEEEDGKWEREKLIKVLMRVLGKEEIPGDIGVFEI